MPTATKNDFFAGVGRRKTAIAQIRVTGGTGQFRLNDQDQALPTKIQAMLELVDRLNKIDISVVVRGGGLSGQLDAALLGGARALVELNPDLRSSLRKGGYLTRDPRKKERKKPGLKGARKAPQWAKR
jgi:small subunit ribosomal protein S9